MNATPYGNEPDALSTRRTLSYGLLGGIAAGLTSSLTLPWGELSATQLLWVESRFVFLWCAEGLALAAVVVVLERRFGALPLLPFLIGSMVLPTLIWPLVPGAGQPWQAANPGHAWGALNGVLFGGAFWFARHLASEYERGRRLFMRAEIARQQTEALLGTERVRALQGQVDPALLLRAMVEVERRYAHDAAGMAWLLDVLVSFLRAAMPGVRSGASTLAAELLLAQQYAALKAELDPGHASWRIRDLAERPDLPFPALLLLPVLDQLVAGDAAAGPDAELDITRDETSCTLRLSRAAACCGAWLTPELLYRLQVGLRAVYGDAWTLVVNERPAPDALVLMLPLLQTSSTGVAVPPFSSPHRLEAIP